MNVERTEIVLKPDQRRVVFLPFKPIREEQIVKIAARVMSLTSEEVDKEKDKEKTIAEFFRSGLPSLA